MKYIIKKIVIGTAIGILLFLFRSYYVAAATNNNPSFAGKKNSEIFYVPANGMIQNTTTPYDRFGLTSAYFSVDTSTGVFMNIPKVTTPPNYIYVDFCTTGVMPALRVYDQDNVVGKTVLLRQYQINRFCDILAPNGDIFVGTYYRAVFGIIQYGSTTSTDTVVQFKGRWYSETNYNTLNRIQTVTTSYEYPLAELSLGNEERIIQELNEIKTILQQNNANNNIINAINNQTTKIEEGNETNEEIRDFLKDSSTPNNSDYNFNSYNEDNGVITNLLTMPITLTQGVLNGLNNGCTSYNFGSIKGQNITFPCINPGQHLGIAWNIIDIIISGVFIFIFGKKCIRIFNDVTNLRSNQVDEVFK